MVDIGTGLKSTYWSPDKSYKRVPLEKLNPNVYTKEQMEAFRKEYQKWWEKEENTSLILLGVAAAIIFMFF